MMSVDEKRKVFVYLLGNLGVEWGVVSSYAYFINKFCNGLGFRFSLISSGLNSRNFNSFIDTMWADDYFCGNHHLYLTEYGEEKLGGIYCEDAEYIEKLHKVIKELSKSEPKVIRIAGISDMIMTDMLKKRGIQGVYSSKEEVMKIVKNFAPIDFSSEVFDKGMNLINKIESEVTKC